MSLTRRTRRESERLQAQLRLRRRQAALRRRQRRRLHLRSLPSLLWQRKTLAVVAALALAAIIAIPVFAPGAPPVQAPADAQPTPEATATPQPPRFDAPPPNVLGTTSRYNASIQTAKGTFVIELFADQANQAVNNVVYLARNQYYAQSQVARVEPGQRVELGVQEPGGPSVGYTIPTGAGGGQPALGSVVPVEKAGGMGAEFAVLLSDAPAPQAGPVIGRVISGLDVVRQLRQGDRVQQVTITEVTSQ